MSRKWAIRQNLTNDWRMRRQLVPGLVVRLTVIKAKTRPGIEAKVLCAPLYKLVLAWTAENYFIAFCFLPIRFFSHIFLPRSLCYCWCIWQSCTQFCSWRVLWFSYWKTTIWSVCQWILPTPLWVPFWNQHPDTIPCWDTHQQDLVRLWGRVLYHIPVH